MKKFLALLLWVGPCFGYHFHEGSVEITLDRHSCSAALLSDLSFPLAPGTRKVRYAGKKLEKAISATRLFRGILQELAEREPDTSELPNKPEGVWDEYHNPIDEDEEIPTQITLDFGVNAKNQPFVTLDITTLLEEPDHNFVKHYSAPVRFLEGSWQDFIDGKPVKVTLTEDGVALANDQLEESHQFMGQWLADALEQEIGVAVLEDGFVDLAVELDSYRTHEDLPTFTFHGPNAVYDAGKGKMVYLINATLTGEPISSGDYEN